MGEVYARSVATGDTYCSHLGALLGWCAAEAVDPVLLDRRASARLVDWLASAPSPSTGRVRTPSAINGVLSAGVRWLRYCEAAGQRPEGPIPLSKVDRPSVSRSGRSARLRRDDVHRLVLAAREDHVLGGVQAKAILATLALVGVRPTDLCRLDLHDVHDADGGTYALDLTGKGDKKLVRWVPRVVAADWYAYLSRARVEPASGEALLVHPRLYRRVNRDDVLALVKRAARRADVADPWRLTARDFRHYFATATRSVSDLQSRQRALGHSSPATTELYDDTAWSMELDPAIRLAAVHDDYPAEELTRPLAHAMPATPVASGKHECDCTPQWKNARVWAEAVGVDEWCRIEITEAYGPGVLAALPNPVCATCSATYLGPFRLRADRSFDAQAAEMVDEQLREWDRYPEAMQRSAERRRDVGDES